MVQFLPIFVGIGLVIGMLWIYVLREDTEFNEMDYSRAPPPTVDNIDSQMFYDGEKMYKYTPASQNDFADPKNNSFIVVE